MIRPVLHQPPQALGSQAVDGIEVRMLLDQALEHGVRDAGGIEARPPDARPVGAATAQRIEPVASFDQQRPDVGAGQFPLQAMAGGNIAGAARAIKEAFAGLESGKVAARTNVAFTKAAVKPPAAAVVTLGTLDAPRRCG
jgi:hypothetical protein